MCDEKLREWSYFRLKKKDEYEWTEDPLGKDTDLLNIVYDITDPIKMQTE